MALVLSWKTNVNGNTEKVYEVGFSVHFPWHYIGFSVHFPADDSFQMVQMEHFIGSYTLCCGDCAYKFLVTGLLLVCILCLSYINY